MQKTIKKDIDGKLPRKVAASIQGDQTKKVKESELARIDIEVSADKNYFGLISRATNRDTFHAACALLNSLPRNFYKRNPSAVSILTNYDKLFLKK